MESAFAPFLLVIFAGGSYLDWFPLRGFTSDDFADLSLAGKIADWYPVKERKVLTTFE